MRHCFGEHPAVYETTGNNPAELLRDAADLLDNESSRWVNLTFGAGIDKGYMLTIYLH